MRLRNNIFDIIINILCVAQLVGIAIYLIVVWNSLPDQIPGHFNAAGEVNRWDNKGFLIIMPVINWMMFAGLVLVERFPHLWNVGVTVTEVNKFRVYRVTKSLLGAIKLIVVTAFTFITIIQSLAQGLPLWFLPVFISLLIATIVIFTIRLLKAR